MVYFGKVNKDGKVEIDQPGVLPAGTTVRIEPVQERDPAADLSVFAVDTGVRDLAAQHDHYASGAPKRKD